MVLLYNFTSQNHAPHWSGHVRRVLSCIKSVHGHSLFGENSRQYIFTMKLKTLLSFDLVITLQWIKYRKALCTKMFLTGLLRAVKKLETAVENIIGSILFNCTLARNCNGHTEPWTACDHSKHKWFGKTVCSTSH